MNNNELWDNLLISVKKSYSDAIKIAYSDSITPTCASAMRATIEGLVKLFYLQFYRRTYNASFKLSKSIKNDDFRKHFTGAEYADIDSIRFVGNEQVHFMFGENIKDDDIIKTFDRAVSVLQEKLKINVIGNNEFVAAQTTVLKENEISDDIKEKWNYIVEKHNENYNRSETVVQRDWEAIFLEIFGYKRVNNEIQSQFSVQIGSGKRIVADIVIAKDNKNSFVAELKQYKLPFTLNMERQIISYFNQLHISIGILVCEKLYLYSYNYAENIVEKIEIPFERNNSNGVEFVKLFDKQNYDEKQIKAFIKEQSKVTLCPIAQQASKAENPKTAILSSEISHIGRKFVIKMGICPEYISSPLNFNVGKDCVLVFDDNICVGVVWEHYDGKNSDAIGQAEIRFFEKYRKYYGLWHRMFINKQRLSYNRLQYELTKTNEFIYYGQIKLKQRAVLVRKTIVDKSSVCVSTNTNSSKVICHLQNRIVECGGESLMPVLKGEPVPFHLSARQDGLESDGLRGVVLKWEIFDAIVKKAISLGGTMYRGDSAAQNGARIGSDELSLDTIDGFI